MNNESQVTDTAFWKRMNTLKFETSFTEESLGNLKGQRLKVIGSKGKRFSAAAVKRLAGTDPLGSRIPHA